MIVVMIVIWCDKHVTQQAVLEADHVAKKDTNTIAYHTWTSV
jgi:hypothetical protein